MSFRNELLSKIRQTTENLPNRTPLPSAEEVAAMASLLVPDSSETDCLVSAFSQRWEEASGIVFDSLADLQAFLDKEGVTAGYIEPETLAMLGVETFPGAVTQYERSRVDEIQFGITKASFAIAETGTIALNDKDSKNRLAALAPWIHVAVLKKETITRTLTEGVARFDDDPSIVFVTGPSKTADIEGILIEGVHGPGRQVVLLV